jgi:hypothetical protein
MKDEENKSYFILHPCRNSFAARHGLGYLQGHERGHPNPERDRIRRPPTPPNSFCRWLMRCCASRRARQPRWHGGSDAPLRRATFLADLAQRGLRPQPNMNGCQHAPVKFEQDAQIFGDSDTGGQWRGAEPPISASSSAGLRRCYLDLNHAKKFPGPRYFSRCTNFSAAEFMQ